MPHISILTSPIPNRALVVDDESAICVLLEAMLKTAGWDVVVASKFEDAKAVIEDRLHPLELLILDLRLPDGDGMALIPLAQQRRHAPDVVIITGWHSEEQLLQALRFGVLDVLYKPFSHQEVGNMLRARTVRERQRLGIVVEKFERVDKEFAVVHQELGDIKSALRRLEATSNQTLRRATGESTE